MKKISILFIVFAILFVFNNGVSAANCAPGDKFNTSNGQLCPQQTQINKALTFTTVLKWGSVGADVQMLQNFLNINGFSVGVADGKFGPKTHLAVQSFQGLHGLTSDGFVGKMTLAVINNIIALNSVSISSSTSSNSQISNTNTSSGQTGGTTSTNTSSFTLVVNPTTIVNSIPVPILSSLSVNSGPVGTSVTITGSGFTATGNKVSFGNTGVQDSPNYNLSSSNGQILVFTVPFGNFMSCWTATPSCGAPAYQITAGAYNVSVSNASGTSNALSFTVTSTVVPMCSYAQPPAGFHYENAQLYPPCGADLIQN